VLHVQQDQKERPSGDRKQAPIVAQNTPLITKTNSADVMNVKPIHFSGGVMRRFDSMIPHPQGAGALAKPTQTKIGR
jgi:hypothetical protein